MKLHYLIVLALAILVSMPCFAADSLAVRGTLVDPAGAPVGGVKVYAVAVVGEVVQKSHVKSAAVSGEDGAFEITGLKSEMDGMLCLVALDPGKYAGWSCYWRLSGRGADDIREQLSKGIKITVSRPGAVGGKVTDERGKPMSGAKVEYQSFSPKVQPVDHHDGFASTEFISGIIKFNSTVTDADGSYTLTGVPEHLKVHPRVTMPGMAMKPRRYDEPEMDVVLIQGGSITGRLVDSRGKSISGSLVGASGPGYGTAVTAKDGKFKIDSLAPGEYRMFFYYARKDNITPVKRQVKVKGGSVTDLARVIFPDSVTVSGRVLDAQSGKPVEGAEVSSSSEDFYGVHATTDANGVYKLKVLPGNVYVYHSGGNKMYIPDRESYKPITVTAKGLRGHNLKIRRADLAKGTVVDEEGRPLAGALVSVGDPSAGVTATTDAQGKFTIAVRHEKQGGG